MGRYTDTRTPEQAGSTLVALFDRWLRGDDELFPVHTCRMQTSMLFSDPSAGFKPSVSVEYRHDHGTFELTLLLEKTTNRLEDILRGCEPGEEDSMGAYWNVESKDRFVAFNELPDIKTVLTYIDTVYNT